MSKKFKVGVIGNGRIGRASLYYLKHSPLIKKAAFVNSPIQAKDFDLLVGALPGYIGQRCLGLALKYGKNLIDLSDVDPPGYLKKEKEIRRRGITVIPGCGFSPGLTNFILGRELSILKNVFSVEIMAGSLSKKRYYYPFLWCFEDIVVEHTIPSYQLIDGKKKKFPVFAEYRKENFFGIPAESYLCASGFENVLDKTGVKNCFCRVVRPQGFMDFFKFLLSYGFLNSRDIPQTKKKLEKNQQDNLTLAQIDFICGNHKISWSMSTFSKSKEKLNSMQKITSAVPVVAAEMLSDGIIDQKGLLFMEELASDPVIFKRMIKGAKEKGILIKREQL
jgi:lysine 6-dehydrogenase